MTTTTAFLELILTFWWFLRPKLGVSPQ